MAKKKKRPAEAIAADVAKTAALVAIRLRARADGSGSGGDPNSRASRRVAQERVSQREPETTPFEAELAATTAAIATRMRARADGGGNGGDERTRALRREA